MKIVDEGIGVDFVRAVEPYRDSRLSIMLQAWSEMYGFALGLPANTRPPDGDVLAVFHAGPSGNETDIRWMRIYPWRKR